MKTLKERIVEVLSGSWHVDDAADQIITIVQGDVKELLQTMVDGLELHVERAPAPPNDKLQTYAWKLGWNRGVRRAIDVLKFNLLGERTEEWARKNLK